MPEHPGVRRHRAGASAGAARGDGDRSALVPSHHDLLAMARAVRRAVVADDGDRLRAGLVQLRDGLTRHLQAERDATDALPDMDRLIAAGGQRRLLDLVTEALAALGGDVDECPCLVRTTQLDVALRRQFLLEGRLLEGWAPPPPRRLRAARPTPRQAG